MVRSDSFIMPTAAGAIGLSAYIPEFEFATGWMFLLPICEIRLIMLPPSSIVVIKQDQGNLATHNFSRERRLVKTLYRHLVAVTVSEVLSEVSKGSMRLPT